MNKSKKAQEDRIKLESEVYRLYKESENLRVLNQIIQILNLNSSSFTNFSDQECLDLVFEMAVERLGTLNLEGISKKRKKDLIKALNSASPNYIFYACHGFKGKPTDYIRKTKSLIEKLKV